MQRPLPLQLPDLRRIGGRSRSLGGANHEAACDDAYQRRRGQVVSCKTADAAPLTDANLNLGDRAVLGDRKNIDEAVQHAKAPATEPEFIVVSSDSEGQNQAPHRDAKVTKAMQLNRLVRDAFDASDILGSFIPKPFQTPGLAKITEPSKNTAFTPSNSKETLVSAREIAKVELSERIACPF